MTLILYFSFPVGHDFRERERESVKCKASKLKKFITIKKSFLLRDILYIDGHD